MSNGGDKSFATPITKKISNVTNKLVSPVRTALVKTPQSSSSSSLGGAGGCGSGAVEATRTRTSRADAQDAKARNSSPSALSALPSPPPPPDSVLSKMNIFLKDKRIRGISMVDYINAMWLEGDGDDVRCSHDVQQPFFASWLESCGKFNICVGGWEEDSSSSSPFVNPWDGEAYDRMRTVTFTTKRSGIGPSTAGATQTHRMRLEGNDRCVVSITVNMNVPFGDSFQVQVRWVVSNVGLCSSGDDVDELSVSVGMLVVFNQSCFVENKIRTNTTNETIKGQTSLFENQKRVCRTISNAKGVAVLQDDGDGDVNENNLTTTMDAANQNRIRRSGEGKMSMLQSIWSLFLILSGWRLLWYLVLAFMSLFGHSDRVVASEDDTDTKQIIMEIKAAKEKLGDLEKLLEEHDVTPNQTESAAAVVRVTNDALRKLINKLN